jgi:hypothetical protein
MNDPTDHGHDHDHDHGHDPGSAPATHVGDRRHRSALLALLGAVFVLVVVSAGLVAALVTRGSAPAGRAIVASDTVPGSVAPAVEALVAGPTAVEVPVGGVPGIDPVTPTGGGPGGSAGGASSAGAGGGSGAPNPRPPSPPTVPPTVPPTPASPAPVITSFATPPNIDCHNGNQQSFSASWSTQHATRVTISIDGPGVYKTYGPTGSDSLPFNCSSSHTFLLTAYGQDGRTVTRTITLQPRNVQQPSPADDEV